MSPHPFRPTIEEIATVFAHLADRVSVDREPILDPIVTASLGRAVEELEWHIPGLQPPLDACASAALTNSARAALDHGLERQGLVRALRGLSFAPHDPELHYLAASACFELGAVESAVRLLRHSLWIHPGYRAARLDLETLSAFLAEPPSLFDDRDGQKRAA